MKEETIAISKFKATCLAVLNRVKQTGKPVLVTRRGEPIALIEPPPQPKRRESWLGMFRSRGTITGDIVSPALSSSEWEALGQ
ncbi:MAG: type II toxin-antitoxin system prevent-host-death family antitoxin [Thermodesulfobacteriota bacterium]|nr:type II toxin-antitoxin system prevent-host-death family antitoxin [Thermodesulfobacteriota bacterium]